jgi:hypothetical protein
MYYETVDNFFSECSRFPIERHQLLVGLMAMNIGEGTPNKDRNVPKGGM